MWLLAAFFVCSLHSAGGPVPMLHIAPLLNCNLVIPLSCPYLLPQGAPAPPVFLLAWLTLIRLPVDIHATISSHSAILGEKVRNIPTSINVAFTPCYVLLQLCTSSFLGLLYVCVRKVLIWLLTKRLHVSVHSLLHVCV